MNAPAAVLSFGSPRSGTTFMRDVLRALDGVFVSKIPEQAPNHPAFCPGKSWGAEEASEGGLVALSQLGQKETLVFVRTVRHPMEVVRSLLATQEPGLREKAGGLASNSDENIVAWIRSESANFQAQASWLLANPYGHRLVQVRYELLDGAARRKRYAKAIASGLPDEDEQWRRLYKALNRRWKKKPSRAGRLSSGIEPDVSEERLDFFRRELAETVEREGYEMDAGELLEV